MTIFRTIGLASIALILCACGNLPRTLEPDPLFNKPTEGFDISSLPNAADGNLCSKDPRLDGKMIPSEMIQFAIARQCTYAKEGTDDFGFWMNRFVDKGLGLSDHTCEAFFDQLEQRRVEASYSQTNVNIAGSAVTAFLAATEGHTRSIFNLATLLTTTNAWFENYKANYILTPQLLKLHSKIQNSLRSPIAKEIREKSQSGGYRSYDEAKRDVLAYDKLCSHKVIQDIVTDSVAKADIRIFAAETSQEKVARAKAARIELYKLATGDSAGDFASGELEALYAVFSISNDPKQRNLAAKALNELEPKFATYTSKLGLDQAALTSGAAANFALINELLNLDSSVDVQKFRAVLKVKMAETKTPPDGGAAAPNIIESSKIQVQRDAFKAQLQGVTNNKSTSTINFGYEILGPRP